MIDETENQDLSEDEKQLLKQLSEDLPRFGAQRRQFLKQITALTGGIVALQMMGEESLFASPLKPVPALSALSMENGVQVALTVNTVPASLQVDSRMTLLDTLRERLNLTGSKKGCDHGQCGACTVIVDGRRVLSCLTLAATCEGKKVTTIEGLATKEQLHPMQAAFVKHDGFQCGYCTPGQICSAVALMDEAKNGEISYVTGNLAATASALQLSDDEIRERMSGNICRCGAYPNIVAAIREVNSGKEVGQTWQFSNENNSPVKTGA